MKPAKHARLVSQQTSIARKVLEAVPMLEPWRPGQIQQEMLRLGGTHTSLPMVNGCLGSLKASGLVREPSPNLWVRVQPRDDAHDETDHQADDEDDHTTTDTTEQDMKQQPIMERMAALASNARALSEQMRALATQIEDVALEAEAEVQRGKDELVKFEQLKSLLASLK